MVLRNVCHGQTLQLIFWELAKYKTLYNIDIKEFLPSYIHINVGATTLSANHNIQQVKIMFVY